ncbi:flagellar protein FlaG [Heliobacterium chlorum]|uniref:Flagellar protein FlaG n=1 Tax=Heliobacterium chlorum TaxID=2698 RepID=A0ABR7T0Z6_HELCL|nr:flagellar protein FlaG [Heliobacterium chlorum]MBC9784458.1 flagellar protein FlaG [Heliobacterium chlorum]
MEIHTDGNRLSVKTNQVNVTNSSVRENDIILEANKALLADGDKENLGEGNISFKPSLDSEQKVKKMVQQINDTLEQFNSHLKFSVHEKTGQIMVQIIDDKNDKVIKEIPPKKLLDFAAALEEVAGLLVDKRV